MFDNIGWLMYAYTRLDSINTLLVILFTVSIFSSGWLALDTLDTRYYELEYERTKKLLTKAIITTVIAALLIIVVPTKKDALLIAGVVTGVAVAEKTVEAVSKSELTGKVLQLVESKIDTMLADAKNGGK